MTPSFFIRSLFPRHCFGCAKALQALTHLQLCDACLTALPRIPNACSRCAYPTPYLVNSVCGKCLNNPPYFDAAYIPYCYQDPIKRWIIQLKFQEHLELPYFLGKLLTNYLHKIPRTTWPNAIIPVPLGKKRLQHRGFNQALEIARFPAKSLCIPILKQAAHRIRNSSPQTQLSRSQRTLNIHQIFQAKLPPQHTHIAIVDDVLTTGNTASELAWSLKKAGAQRVELWGIARVTESPLFL